MKINIIFQILLTSLVIAILVIVINLFMLEKQNEIKLVQLQKVVDENMSIINSSFEKLSNDNEEIINCINTNAETNLKQFSETKRMKFTYDKLLEEQQKKTVDISGKDSLVIELIANGNEFFSKENYMKAYDAYSKVLQHQPENNEIRFMKMCSLYYSNSMSSLNQNEILEDCELLKKNGFINEKLNTIEKSVRQEKDGLVDE